MAETETLTAPETAAAATPVPSWRDSLPEDLKADKSLESFKDVGALAKSFVETKKLVGQKALAVPGDGATPEEKAAFHAALGVPKTPAEYKLKGHEMMAHPEWNRGAQDAFLKIAHAHGFTPAQADAAVQFYANFIGEQVKSNTTMATEGRVELKTDWGVNYDAFMGIANQAMTQTASALGVERGDLYNATSGTDPALVARLFHWVGSNLAEHGLLQGEPAAGITTPAEAAGKMQELQAQLLKVPEGSQQARALIDQIANLGRAIAPRAA